MILLHRIAHLMGWNGGHVWSRWDDEAKRVQIGFQCATCGEVSGLHHASRRVSFPELYAEPEQNRRSQD